MMRAAFAPGGGQGTGGGCGPGDGTGGQQGCSPTYTFGPPPAASDYIAWQMDVGYMPVTSNFGQNFDHLFVWFHEVGTTAASASVENSVVFDGGPLIGNASGSCGSPPPLCGSVTAWASVQGNFNELTNPQMVDFWSTGNLTPIQGGYVEGNLVQTISRIDRTNVPYFFLGPNSNTVAYQMLTDLGLAGSVGIQTTTLPLPFGTISGVMLYNGVLQYFPGWGMGTFNGL